MAEQRVKIGHLCAKGPHTAFIGDPDYEVCAGHDDQDIYLVVDDAPDLDLIAADLAQRVQDSCDHIWCGPG